MGNRYADHVTPLYPQKLALTSPTGGGRSVVIVRTRSKATEFSLVLAFEMVNGLCFKTWRSAGFIYSVLLTSLLIAKVT